MHAIAFDTMLIGGQRSGPVPIQVVCAHADRTELDRESEHGAGAPASTAAAASNADRRVTADRPDQADAKTLASVAARTIVATQAGAVHGEIGADLEAGGNFRLVVHQATGMVWVELGVPVDEALIRLRAHAFHHDRSVAEVARDLVERRLRFGEDPDA